MTTDGRLLEPGPRRSAAELGLPDDVYAGLIWVRDALDPWVPAVQLPFWLEFHMSSWGSLASGRPVAETACGTAFCIGGTLGLRLAGLLGVDPDWVWTEADSAEANRAERRLDSIGSLYALFYRYRHEAGGLRGASLAVWAIDRLLGGEIHDPWGLGLARARADRTRAYESRTS